MEKGHTQEANLVEEVEDSPDFWSGTVQSYNSPVQNRFLIGLDRSTNGPLPNCDRKCVSVRTMPPGQKSKTKTNISFLSNLQQFEKLGRARALFGPEKP